MEEKTVQSLDGSKNRLETGLQTRDVACRLMINKKLVVHAKKGWTPVRG